MDPSSPGSHHARRLWPTVASLVAVALVALFWRVLFLGETFGDRDLAKYYHPAKSLVAPLTWASAGIPTWNPFFASGQPFAANPEHAIFFPLTTLFLLLPFELAYRLQVMIPVAAAIPGMYVLLRTLRRTRAGALAGGLAWGLGGFLLSTTNLLPILFALALLPLVLVFVVRLARQTRARDIAGLGLCFGVECLAGEPSTLIATIPLCAGALLAVNRRPAWRTLLGIGGGFVLGAALGAVALLPGLHHASKTDRAAGLDREETGEWSMPPVRLLDLASPHVLGQVVPGDETKYWGRSLYGRRASPYYFSLYPGLAMSLLGLAAWTVRRRTLWPWIAVAVVGTLLALGAHFPLWGVLRRLPILESIRFPEKWVLLLILPLTVAAAYGFDQAVMGPRRARRFLLRALLVMAGLGMVAAVAVAAFSGGFAAGFPWRMAAGVGLRLALVALASFAALAIFRRARRTTRALALCAVLVVDLVTAGATVVHTVPVAILASPPRALLPLVNSQRDHLLYHAAERDSELSEVEGIAKPPQPAQWGIAMTLETDFDRTWLRWTNDGHRLFQTAIRRDPQLWSPLLQRRGVTAVLRFRSGSRWVGGGVVGPDARGPLEVLASRDTRPVLSPVARVEIVRNEGEWLQAVLRLGSAARDTALVDGSQLPSFAGEPSPADLSIHARTPRRIALEVTSQGPAPSFVAFNQTWDEGWRLRVDGRPAPLLRTEVSLAGFVVPPGKHTVEIVHRDAWVEFGVVLSLGAVLVCFALALLGRRLRSARGVS
jgi:hypothetical protein